MCLDLTFITVLLQQGFGLSPDKALHVSDVRTVTSKSVRKWNNMCLGRLVIFLHVQLPSPQLVFLFQYESIKMLNFSYSCKRCALCGSMRGGEWTVEIQHVITVRQLKLILAR
jgi:hypothetical protein